MIEDKRIRTTIFLKRSLKKRLDKHKEKIGVSNSETMNRVLENYLNEWEGRK